MRVVEYWLESEACDRVVHPWAVWNPIACAMVHRRVQFDCTLVQRGAQRMKLSRELPVAPTRAYLRSVVIDDGHVGEESLLANAAQWQRKGFIKGFQWNPEILIKSAEIFVDAANSRSVPRVVANSRSLAHMLQGNVAAEVVQSSKQGRLQIATKKHAMPGKTIMYSAVIKIDFSYMRGFREWFRAAGPFVRQCFIDASPLQYQSYEVLNSSEIIFKKDLLLHYSRLTLPDSEITRRKLCPAGLAQGCCDAANKCEAFFHQNWLDYGPTADSLRSGLHSIVWILADLGVERLICDFFDMTDFYLSGRSSTTITAESRRTFAFPNAMRGGGPLHIVDWLIRECVGGVCFFPEFLRHLKNVLQFLHGQNHRDYIKQKLRSKVPEGTDLTGLLCILDSTPGRFANWRWRSLWKACKDFHKFLPCLQRASENDDPLHWNGKCCDAFKSISHAVKSDLMDTECTAIMYMTKRLVELDGWIRGCPCHDRIKDPPSVWQHCKKSGWRAPEFFDRVTECIQDIDNDAACIVEGQFGSIPEGSSVVHCALTKLSTQVDLKLRNFLDKLPYLIWRAAGVE